jgi:hypothetical protein
VLNSEKECKGEEKSGIREEKDEGEVKEGQGANFNIWTI